MMTFMLRVLGLSETEEAVYEVLVSRPPVTPEELAALMLVDAGAVLERLRELGLVIRLLDDVPPRYAVVPVDAALAALIATKERALAAARQRIDRLADRLGQAPTAGDMPLVEVVQGRPAVEARLEALLRGARREMRGFDAPPYLAPPQRPQTREVNALRSGVRYRVIYDRQAVMPDRLPDIDETVAAGEEARVTDVPMKLGISDEPLAMLPLHNDPVDLDSWLVVRDPVLLGALSALFEVYWQRAVPLRVARSKPDLVDADGPTEAERDLLTLLVAGRTDREIADHFGWHERTAHRHLRAMIARLDAVTRFQAGYQAVRRGWLIGTPDD